MAHTCNAECWALLVRYGQESFPSCDPWAARAAADREAYQAGAVS